MGNLLVVSAVTNGVIQTSNAHRGTRLHCSARGALLFIVQIAQADAFGQLCILRIVPLLAAVLLGYRGDKWPSRSGRACISTVKTRGTREMDIFELLLPDVRYYCRFIHTPQLDNGILAPYPISTYPKSV